MCFIYILQLEEGKYYIGKTNHPSFRLENHFESSGSAWTKKYRPISVIEVIPNCDAYDEDKYTLQYMEKYGIENVRGVSFCQIILNENNIVTLRQMLNGAADKCYQCGSPGNFAKDCKKEMVEKEKRLSRISNEKCDCVSSYFSPHRRKKCLLTNVVSLFEE